MVIKVVVRPDKDGYMARAEGDGLKMCWSLGKTIDEAVNKFREEYGALLKIQFTEQLVFEFAVELKV